MRPHLESTLEIRGDLNGSERRRFSLDEASLPHLMSVLTKQYSNSALAVIREYSSNAWDSHQAAGNPDPIQVTLPTHMHPTFYVQDQGTGMSVDDVLNHFTKYGWSSKRESNDEVGMLGLGCKAAFTYTDQFSIIAVKDGVQTTVLLLLDPQDRVPEARILDTCATDEPNGVTVQIPVHDPNDFNKTARRFFQYWEPGSVQIDGEGVEPLSGQYIDPDVCFITRDPHNGLWDGSDIVIMGNIAYPVDQDHTLHELRDNIHGGFQRSMAVVRVPIGSVQPTPNREALQYNALTLETLAIARQFIRDTLMRQAQQHIDDAPNGLTAMQRAVEWRERASIPQHMLTYHGRQIPRDFSPVKGLSLHLGFTEAFNEPAYSFTHLSLHDVFNDTIILNHPTKRISPTQKAKLRAFIKHRFDAKKDRHVNSINVLDPQSTQRFGLWLDGAPRIFDWSQVEEMAAQTKQAKTKRYTILADRKAHGRNYVRAITVTSDALPTNKPFLLISTKHWSSTEQGARLQQHIQARLYPHYTIVLLHPQSWDRFKREHEDATVHTIYEGIAKGAQAHIDSLTPTQKVVLANGRNNETFYSMLSNTFDLPDQQNEQALHAAIDALPLEDPYIPTYLKEVASLTQASQVARQWDYLWNKVAETVTDARAGVEYPSLSQALPDDKEVDYSLVDTPDRYPLLKWGGHRWPPREAVIEYINLLYRSRQEDAA